MSAPASADQLLAEITSTSLLSIINAVRHDVAPPPHTGIPPLDDLLVSARKGMEGLLAENALARGDMLEIQGPSGSGKTSLLNILLLAHILPSQHTFTPISPSTKRHFPTPTPLGGSSLSAIIFSLSPSSPFSLIRLEQHIRAHVLNRFVAAAATQHAAIAGRATWPASIATEIDTVVADALRRVRVWRGSGGIASWELAVGLKRVPSLVLEDFGPEEELGLVAIDNFGEGHFQDGWEFTQNASGGLSHSSLQDITTQPMYHILRSLTTIRLSLGALVVVTTQTLLPPTTSTTTGQPSPFPTHHLPFPYANSFPPPNAFGALPVQTRPLPEGIRGITHHVSLVTPGERLGAVDLGGKGLGEALKEEGEREKGERGGRGGGVRGWLRVVGGVHGAGREGKSWQIGLGRDGVEIF